MPDNFLWYIVFSPILYSWLQCNRIHSGLRSGIVVLGNGRGSIRSNQIYGNKEAGVYILFNGNPVVRYTVQGLLCFIQIMLANKNKIRYICLLSWN